MTELFYAVLKAGFHGSIVILAVMALRFLLKKAPRSTFCLLWLLAGLRLVLPFEIESSLSLQPKLEEPEISIQIQQPVQVPDIPVQNPEGQPLDTPPVQAPAPPERNWESPQTETFIYQAEDDTITAPLTWTDIAAPLWLLGMAAMLSASAVSYWKLKRRVREGYLIENGCYECPGLDTAFVLGFLPPKIYLPLGLNDREKAFIYAHESTHIARHDHWFKLLGYAVLSIHWFNPLVWAGYHLLCRDIELACDEHVVRNMDLDQRKAYSAALLSCGGRTARIAACPVAFGESNPKKRILNVLHYKRPTFWITLLAVIAVIFVSVCLLTSPEEEQPPEEPNTNPWNLEMQVSDVTPTGLTVIFVQSGEFSGSDRAQLQYGTYYTLQRLENGQWTDVEMLPHEYDVAWTMEAYLIELNSTHAHNVDWGWLYGDLPAGHYRIGKDVDLFRTAGDLDSQMLYAEFDIGEKAVTDEELVTQCREAMLRLKNSGALHLYIENLDDPNAVINTYMKSSRGWLFQYRRPQWDYTYVTWLRHEGTQYLYSGDMNDDGIMTAPYYWQTEQNPESHTFQLPYPFDLAWESIELTYGGAETQNSMKTVTLYFPLHGDVFRLTFDPDKTLCWFDVGDTSGEPEAATTRFYVLSTEESEVEEKLSSLYREAVSNAGQKPGAPDETAYQELFSRIADGAYTTMWISDLYETFYADPAGFVSRLAQSERVEEILTCMKHEVAYNAPYYFNLVLSQLEQSGNPDREIIEMMQAFTSRNTQAQQQEDDLNDQIAWLAKCAAALDFYQAHGTWAIQTESSFWGVGVLEGSSLSQWFGNGEDYYTWTRIPDDGGDALWFDLCVDGEAYHRHVYSVTDGSVEDWNAQWKEGSTDNQAIYPPWPLWYNWAGTDIEFVEQVTTDSMESVTFTVRGCPFPEHPDRIDEYQVTFNFREDVLFWIQLTYQRADALGGGMREYKLSAFTPADAENISKCHSEALLHVHGICNDPECTNTEHDHYGIACTVEHCTNPAHGHGDEHHSDEHHD